MLTEQEKKLLAEADARAKNTSKCGLEAYLTETAREQVKEHPARTAWAIHFHAELCRQQEKSAAGLQLELLEQAHLLADATVAHDLLGERAFDYRTYLTDRKLREEFLQVVQRYRGRLIDPGVKTILLRMAEEICASTTQKAA
jgi:hypothetical protein